MSDYHKTKAQLLKELAALRQTVAELRQQATTPIAAAPKMEGELPSSAERFRQFILSINDHAYVTEVTETGRQFNLYISANFETLTGYPEAQLRADGVFWPSWIIHPDDRPVAAAQVAQLARGKDSEAEYRLVRANGQIVWVHDSARVERVGASTLVYGIVSDITERKRREMGLDRLLELSRALVTTHTPTAVLDQAIKAATETAPAADRGSLQLLDDTGQTLHTVAISSPDETLGQVITFRPGEGIAGHALASNQTINVADVLADERFLPSELPLRFRSLLVAPLVVKSRLIGTLSLSSQKVGAFVAADEILVQLIADQVAAALENARLFDSYLQAENLRKAHQFLQATIDALASHIAILDERGQIIAVNARWRLFAEANGYAGSNYGLGLNYLEICEAATGPDAEEAPMVAEGIREVMAGQRNQFYLEYPAHNPLERRWFGVRVTHFQDAEATWLVVTHEDVTERRLAEEALRASEEKYRNLTNQLPVGVYRDTPPGKLVYANPALAVILGYNNIEEMLQTSIRNVFDNPQERDAHLARCHLNGEVAYHELKARTAEGAQIWVRDTARVFLNEAGEIDYIDGIIQDITDHRAAAEALKASEIRFRSLIQNSSDIITLLAADGRVQYVSPPVEWILGYPPERVVGRNVFSYVHPEDLPGLQTRFHETTQHPGIDDTPFEFRMRDAQGQWRWLEAVSNNLLDDPNVKGIVVNGRDISRRKQMEEQLRLLEAQFLQSQKMDAIGRLAGGVAHDFNNVLTVIRGYSDLLLMHLREPEDLRSYVEQIRKATNHAASVTRQLLIFSRQEMAQPEIIDLNGVMIDLEKMLERLIAEDVDLEIRLDPALGLVKMNPGHIEQVVMNLVINARDAMPYGGQITIQTANIAIDETTPLQPLPLQPGRYAQLTVTDTGIGMDQETLSHIFEPFYTTKEQGKGTGLGLSTVYAIVNQSKGSIQVYSQPEQGTTFQVYLPCLTDQIGPDLRMADNQDLDAAPGKKLETILLVEDEVEVRKLTRLILLKQGYHVLEAQHGEEALRLCQQSLETIHLVLTDVVMPNGMNGRELAERLKVIRPEAKILFMSGYTDDVILRHGVLDANLNFIQKPFTLNILLRKIRETLDASQ